MVVVCGEKYVTLPDDDGYYGYEDEGVSWSQRRSSDSDDEDDECDDDLK